jgi:mannose-6-phosphate isomerase-like protein (cupin superfamily)
MTGYTALDLTALANVSTAYGFAEDEMQFRPAREALGCEQSAMSHLRLGPGYRMPFAHRHRVQEEVYVVVSGSARVAFEEGTVELGPLHAVRIAPGTIRGVEAGPDGCELILFGAPGTGPGDAETAEGWWPD